MRVILSTAEFDLRATLGRARGCARPFNRF